jgi:hypothetical protein
MGPNARTETTTQKKTRQKDNFLAHNLKISVLLIYTPQLKRLMVHSCGNHKKCAVSRVQAQQLKKSPKNRYFAFFSSINKDLCSTHIQTSTTRINQTLNWRLHKLKRKKNCLKTNHLVPHRRAAWCLNRGVVLITSPSG